MKYIKSLDKKKKKIILGIVVATLVAGGGYIYYSFQETKKMQELQSRWVELYSIPGREKVFMNGKILPSKSEKISVKPEHGELNEIKVADKSYVKKGSPLFTCKNNEEVKQIASLKSELNKKYSEKSKAPDEESKLMVDEEIKDLNSQISELNKTAYNTVYAPFDGKVYLNDSEENQHILTIETADFYVKGQVNERDSYKIKNKQGVEISVIATDDKHKGKIKEIADIPYVGESLSSGSGMDSNMTNYEVKMSIDNQKKLKHGLNVQITAFSENSDVKVPNVSVEEISGKYYVYRVENKIAIKTEVKISDKKSDYYLVKEGLREGEEIIKDIIGKDIKDGEEVYLGEDHISNAN